MLPSCRGRIVVKEGKKGCEGRKVEGRKAVKEGPKELRKE